MCAISTDPEKNWHFQFKTNAIKLSLKSNMVSVLPENVSRKYQISNYFSEVYIIILTMLMHVCELSLSTLYMVSVKPTIIIYSNFSNMKVSMFDGLSLSEIANYKFLLII